ncbi:MAG: hypothetical protein SFY66_22535 [Oculatellaceae cyanobacterium bins.114]|nr:hypothetical protein [Oculatellaceae cyanobacterium bins.114]
MNLVPLMYYMIQSRFSNPHELEPLLTDLPLDLDNLHKAIHGLLIHIWKVRKFYPNLLRNHAHDVFTRRIHQLIQHIHQLDNQPLSVTRPATKRAIVDSRNFALLLTTVLRQRGIPARVRCGFATYLQHTHYQDYWICEYWSDAQRRWMMEDVTLQLHDITSSQFITGAQAWQLCRTNSHYGTLFGWGAELTGMWATRVNLIRDFAALNDFECVSGDQWGLMLTEDTELTQDDLVLLDHVARLAQDDECFEERKVLYDTNPQLHAYQFVHHSDIASNQWQEVKWRKLA